MALRRKGKKNYWHCYYAHREPDADGVMRKVQREVNLYTKDYKTAQAMEKEIMLSAGKKTARKRLLSHLSELDIVPTSEEETRRSTRKRRRLKLEDWEEAVRKYRTISETQKILMNKFVKEINLKYFDEVTPDAALTYLETRFTGKTFNNHKTAVNTIFKFLLIDAGMTASPFDSIPNRQHTARHQRPFTEEEFQKIVAEAPEPWRTASIIAWYTGLREESVFNLRWENIDKDILTVMPGKTARFGRAVQIPLHPELQRLFAELPRTNDKVLGCFKFYRGSGKFEREFGKVLKRLKIEATEDEIVCFNSFRNSFITRCDVAGIPRHATRGIVGQVADKTTDLYSRDLTTARLIQNLPTVKLAK